MIKSIEVGGDKDLHNGTSYHGMTIIASRKHLTDLFGEPKKGSIDGKVKYLWEFICKDENNGVFGVTLYDWKFSKVVTEMARINWNIGAKNEMQAKMFMDYLKTKYNLEAEKYYSDL